MDDDSKVIVCDKCLRAICWHGEMLCSDAFHAGTRVLTVRELRLLALEHEDNWSDGKMIEIYGSSDRDFSNI